MPFSDFPQSISEYQQKYDSLTRCDPVVTKSQMLARNCELSELDSLRVCVVHLAEQRDHLQEQLIHAQAIAPRRIKMADGRVYRWDAPDDVVPIND